MTPTLLISGFERTLFTDSAPEGAPFEGEPEDDWLVRVRREPKTGRAHHIDCSGRAWKAICKAAKGLPVEDQQSVLEQFLSNQTALAYAEGFRNDLGKPLVPSRLSEIDLPGRFLETNKTLQDFELGEDASRLDALDGFPDEQAKRFWVIGPDGIRLGSDREEEPAADADEVAVRLARYREGFEALERAYNAHTHVQSEFRTGPVFPIPAPERLFHVSTSDAIPSLPPQVEPFTHIGFNGGDLRPNLGFFHVSTSPDTMLQALYRWGEKHAGERLSVSPKLFAVLDSRCFPDGRSVLARFLETARVVKPYFSVEVDVFGLTGEEILAGETWPRRGKG